MRKMLMAIASMNASYLLDGTVYDFIYVRPYFPAYVELTGRHGSRIISNANDIRLYRDFIYGRHLITMRDDNREYVIHLVIERRREAQ